MYFDGSLKLQEAGAEILFIAPGGEQLKYALQLLFLASNNVTEYEAVVHEMSIAVSLGIKKLMVYGDSLVVISQINKDCDCSTDSMGIYYAAVRKLEDMFEGLEFHHVERDRNVAADALSKLEFHHVERIEMHCRSSAAVADHSHNLVVRMLGAGHDRTFQEGSVRLYSYWLPLTNSQNG
jgi:ribonuclease HI